MKRTRRRQFMKLAAMGVCGCAANLWWGARAIAGATAVPVARGADAFNTKAGTVFDQAEDLTRTILARMRNSLRQQLADHPEPFSDTFRTYCINMAMQPLIAPLTQDFLTWIGDSATARKRLFFLMPLVEWMSEPFLFPVETGGSPQEQIKEMDKVFNLMGRLHEEGMTTSLDNVGDASLSAEDSLAYRNYYSTLIRAYVESDRDEDLYLSLKLAALVHDLDAAIGSGSAAQDKQREIKDALTDLLELANTAPGKTVFLRIDMEEYRYKNLTIRLFREIVEAAPALSVDPKGNLRIGLVIQAYLRDSAADVRDLTHWARERNLRVPIRLVKGAYLDHERQVAEEQGYPSPVWDDKPSTDANYEALSACMLLNPDAVRPAFATHNIRTQAHAMALAQAYGLPDDTPRIQMLYGMGDPIKRIVVDMGHSLREYVPAGSLARGLKYSGRRFEELANSDNALAKTLRGDFSDIDGTPPTFIGGRDQADSRVVRLFLEESLARKR